MLSRVADNLYWMSRYLERAEHTSRLIAVKLETIVEQTRDESESTWRRVIAALSADAPIMADGDPMSITNALAFERVNSSSLISSVRFARDNARQVRELISTELWNELNQLYLKLQPLSMQNLSTEQPSAVFRETIQHMQMLEGIAYSTMRHGEGWHFMQLGRYIERAQLISRLLELHFGAASWIDHRHQRELDNVVLLKFCTAFEAYCKVYTANIRRDRIAEFLLFDAEFPHSVHFSVKHLSNALGHVAPGAPAGRRAACERLAGRLKASVDFGQIEELIGGAIDVFLGNVAAQCEQIHDAVYAAYIAYDAETGL